MAIDAVSLKTLIDHELGRLSDHRVLAHIRSLLVEPKPVLRAWDYGKPGEQFPCWTVLNHDDSNTGIAYCESGFGPRCPWGLVWLSHDDQRHMSMGMDSGWFPTFLEAHFDSFAATGLPIWRVFKTESSGDRHPMTGEDSWKVTWERVIECRKSDPASRYDCDHGIAYWRQGNRLPTQMDERRLQAPSRAPQTIRGDD